MARKTTVGICCLLVCIICGCNFMHAPQIMRYQRDNLSPSYTPTLVWKLDSLRPVEETVLIDGQTVQVSVYMEAAGEGEYLLQMSANGKRYGAFRLKLIQGSGEINFFGTATWPPKVIGKAAMENITISLYRIERSKSNKTEISTLLTQFKRRYNVMCDNKQCAITLIIKKLFNRCHCTVTGTRLKVTP